MRLLTYLALCNKERKQIPSSTTHRHKTLQGMNCMAGICVLCCFFFLFFLLGEDICVFTVSWRKLWAQCMLCARVRVPERTSNHVSKPVSMQRVEQLNSSSLRRRYLLPNQRRNRQTTLVFVSLLAIFLFVRC